MTGTLVNAAAIAAGGCVGLLLKKGVKGSHQDSINKALGVAVLVLGLNGVISSMFTVNADGTLASSGELLLIISLVLGTLAGEALRIDDRLNGLSGLVERRLHLSGFAQSFVNGALIYCVGAMAIIGALNDGLRGDASVLYIKSLLDGISSVVLGATLGPGVIFAALPVLVYQGAISLLAGALEPFLAGELLGQICGVGYCLARRAQRYFGGNLVMVFERIREIICDQLDLEEDKVTMDSDIMEDFEADSLDVVDLVMSIEDEFGLEVPDDQIENFRTVGDVVRYIEENS